MAFPKVLVLLSLLPCAPPGPGADQPAPGGDAVAALIHQLDAAAYDDREAAARQLLVRGEDALPALRRAADDGRETPEVRRRAHLLVDAILEDLCTERAAGMKFRVIPAGEFRMGSLDNEPGRQADEPLHPVRLTRAFLLGTYEVTQAEYARVMASNPSHFHPRAGGKDKVADQDTLRFPVDGVTWYDALEFCNRLSRLGNLPPHYALADVKRTGERITAATVAVRGGHGFRLPTEAEWEYACRAGTDTRFHYGRRTTNRDANLKTSTPGGYGGPPAWHSLGRSEKVGQYQPNGLGLYDMHGNVAEWCWDYYDAGYYRQSPPADPRGPERGTHRVLRGGSWLVADDSGRSASRFWQVPGEGTWFTGFRVARTPR